MMQHILQDTSIGELRNNLRHIQRSLKEEKQSKHSLIIAGSSMTLIDADENLKMELLEATHDIEVVLACRVSPKQKADIVQMVRNKY